jgi:hypothetical protein
MIPDGSWHLFWKVSRASTKHETQFRLCQHHPVCLTLHPIRTRPLHALYTRLLLASAQVAMAQTFSLEGRALKLDSAADMDKHIAELKANNDVEGVIFAGNTLGVEACKALAQVLESKKKLRVRCPIVISNGQI